MVVGGVSTAHTGHGPCLQKQNTSLIETVQAHLRKAIYSLIYDIMTPLPCHLGAPLFNPVK